MPRFSDLLPRWKTVARDAQARRRPLRSRPSCEGLEGRALLSGLGADYTLMGGEWDDSRPISFSIAPDGVSWGQGTNVANSQLDSEFGGTSWELEVARALQTWSLAANINFTMVGDGAYALNAQGLSQGDSRFGDIRVGGFNMNTTATIAETYGPPPNGTTGAGDVMLNTGFNFSPTSSRYDFETVILHELGHSLGLGESPQPSSVMYSYYSGVRQSLSSYDVEGIQSIYGARTADAFQAQGRGTSAANAVDLTTALDANHQGHINGVSLATVGDVEYFSVVAPALNGATMKVSAQAYGISLLSPQVTVIDPSTGKTLAVDAHPDQFGNTSSVSIPGAIAGHTYLIEVTGATGKDVFSAGAYAIQVGFNGGTAPSTPTPAPVTPAPVAPTPVAPAPTTTATPKAPAILPDRYAGDSTFATATELGAWTGQGVVANLTMPTGKEVRVFTFEPTSAGTVMLASANTTMIVGDATGRQVVSGTGLISFQNAQAGSRYFLVIVSPNAQPIASFGFAINMIPAPAKSVVVPVSTTVSVPTPTHPTKGKAQIKAASLSKKAAKVAVHHE